MKRIRRLWFFIAIIFAFNIIMYLTHWGGDKVLLYVSDILPIVCSLVSLICLLFAFNAFKVYDFVKTAWLLILVGICLDFFAEIAYSLLEIVFLVDLNEVFPTVADYIWCSAYVPVIAGLVIMFCGYRRSGLPMGNIKAYTIISPLILVIYSLVIIFLLIPIIKDSETDLIAKIFYMFYPIADMLVVLPVILLMYITSLFGKGLISRPWRYLALGFICFTFADILYSYLSWQDVYGSGNLIDLGWNIGYLLIGLSGLYQKQLIDSINGGE